MKNLLAAVLLALGTTASLADEAHHEKRDTAQGASQASSMAQGEVRRIDKDAKKITIKHGPLESLDMPAMTMVFQVKEPSLLEQVKPGDKVMFQAQKLNGALVVTQIQAAK